MRGSAPEVREKVDEEVVVVGVESALGGSGLGTVAAAVVLSAGAGAGVGSGVAAVMIRVRWGGGFDRRAPGWKGRSPAWRGKFGPRVESARLGWPIGWVMVWCGGAGRGEVEDGDGEVDSSETAASLRATRSLGAATRKLGGGLRCAFSGKCSRIMYGC